MTSPLHSSSSGEPPQPPDPGCAYTRDKEVLSFREHFFTISLRLLIAELAVDVLQDQRTELIENADAASREHAESIVEVLVVGIPLLTSATGQVYGKHPRPNIGTPTRTSWETPP